MKTIKQSKKKCSSCGAKINKNNRVQYSGEYENVCMKAYFCGKCEKNIRNSDKVGMLTKVK